MTFDEAVAALSTLSDVELTRLAGAIVGEQCRRALTDTRDRAEEGLREMEAQRG